MSDVQRTFAALGDRTRHGIVELLSEGDRRAGELSDALGTSKPAMSRHLKVLRKRGLVEEVRDADPDDARVRVYRLRREPFDDLQRWLDEVQAYWTDQLDAFREHIEAEER